MLIRTVCKLIIGLILGVVAAACAAPAPSPPVSDSAAAPTPASLSAASLPDMGPAPSIDNQIWLNTEAPLSLQALRGKVVLIEFWTFG